MTRRDDDQHREREQGKSHDQDRTEEERDPETLLGKQKRGRIEADVVIIETDNVEIREKGDKASDR